MTQPSDAEWGDMAEADRWRYLFKLLEEIRDLLKEHIRPYEGKT